MLNAWSKVVMVTTFGLSITTFVLSGCVGTFHETNLGEVWWRTETRMQWRWWGIPMGKYPVDVYFRTQELCESFRKTHPLFTHPGETCKPVRGEVYQYYTTEPPDAPAPENVQEP